jgi:hypothetical protein
MATFSVVSIEEGRQAVLPPRRAVQEQYRQYIRQLDPDTAGQLQLSESDKSITERARLKAAARAEGMNLHIQRQGNTIVFWKVAAEPKAPAKNGRRK